MAMDLSSGGLGASTNGAGTRKHKPSCDLDTLITALDKDQTGIFWG
jgi:hypothetical protein